MNRYKKLSHVIYYHNDHIVWTPKYRYRVLEGVPKDLLDNDIRMLCEWKGAEVLELSIQRDHVHMVVSVPPRVSILELMGTVKGKTAIKIFKSYPALKKKPYWDNHFWSRGYCSSTIGLDEEKIRKYIQYQRTKSNKKKPNNSILASFRGQLLKPPSQKVDSLLNR